MTRRLKGRQGLCSTPVFNFKVVKQFGLSEDWNLGSAIFSEDRRYRYLLRRRVGNSTWRVLFIMLNPSMADEERNDPTIRRCIGFGQDWGFGLLDVVNLFAMMSTDPRALLKAEDPIGPDNDAAIRAALEVADTVVLAWGNHALDHKERAAAVAEMAREVVRPYCLGLTLRGAPKHPLRLSKDTLLTPFCPNILSELKTGD